MARRLKPPVQSVLFAAPAGGVSRTCTSCRGQGLLACQARTTASVASEQRSAITQISQGAGYACWVRLSSSAGSVEAALWAGTSTDTGGLSSPFAHRLRRHPSANNTQ